MVYIFHVNRNRLVCKEGSLTNDSALYYDVNRFLFLIFKTFQFSGIIFSPGAYGITYQGALAKNRDADLGNPNVYHSIEDLKQVEHLYDEIKAKEAGRYSCKEFVFIMFVLAIYGL